MNKKQIIQNTIEFVKKKAEDPTQVHDWSHTQRVVKLSKRLAKGKKGIDTFKLEMGALMHDIADYKFNNNSENEGELVVRKYLERLKLPSSTIDQICDIAKNVSYRGALVDTPTSSIEGMIVQDADRLDALGAIGIARAFAYGGEKKRAMYDPTINSVEHKSFEEYKSNQSTTINHFYEKLLLLKDRLNTQEAKKLAEKRHTYMLSFLNRFYKEWDAKD